VAPLRGEEQVGLTRITQFVVTRGTVYKRMPPSHINTTFLHSSSLNGSHGEWTESDDVDRKNWNTPHKRKITLPREKPSPPASSQIDKALSQLAACGLTGETPPEREPRPEGVRAPTTARQKKVTFADKTPPAGSTPQSKGGVVSTKVATAAPALGAQHANVKKAKKPEKLGEVAVCLNTDSVFVGANEEVTDILTRNQRRTVKRCAAKDAEHQEFLGRVVAATRRGTVIKLERMLARKRWMRNEVVCGVIDQVDFEGFKVLDSRFVRPSFMRRVRPGHVFDEPLLRDGQSFDFNCRVRPERLRIKWLEVIAEIGKGGLLDSAVLVTTIERRRANAIREIWEAKMADVPDGDVVIDFFNRAFTHGLSRAMRTQRKFISTPFVGQLDPRAISEFENRYVRLRYTKQCKVVIIYVRDPIGETLWKRFRKRFYRWFARRVDHEYNHLLHEHATAEAATMMGSVIYQEDYLMQNRFTRERHTLADPRLYAEVSKFASGLNVGDHTMLRYLYTKFIRQEESHLPLDIRKDTILKAYQDLIYRASRDKLSCMPTVAAPPDGKT